MRVPAAPAGSADRPRASPQISVVLGEPFNLFPRTKQTRSLLPFPFATETPSMYQRLLPALIALFCLAPIARADDFINQANAAYKPIQAGKRSDNVLLPLLAKMDPPPAGVATLDKAMVTPAGSSGWSAAEAWVNAAPQRAVLEALHNITQEENPVEAFAFGQPYGSSEVGATSDGVAMVRAGLYTELGDPPLLAAAKFLYLPALDRAACAVHVEATRLAAAGKVYEGMDVLIDWLFFARQMADRIMFTEARWGFHNMNTTLDRIRDVAYVDFRYGERKLTAEQINKIVQRLRPDGYIGVDRLNFPKGNQIAAKQVVASTFVEATRAPNLDTFAPTMSRLASTQRPLRLFAEAARWNEVASVHANFLETGDQIDRIFGDWSSRWPLDAFDRRHDAKTDYEKTSKRSFPVILTVVEDQGVLFNDRQILRTQLVGVRCSLGVIAFYYQNKDFPPKIESIRPAFVKIIEADPYNPDRANKKQPPLEYFVPIRDQPVVDREVRGPHEMNVLPLGGQTNFQVKIDKDQFIIYSVGPDGAKAWAKDVSGEPAKNSVGDLLIWPPVTSLLRQRMQETHQIK